MKASLLLKNNIDALLRGRHQTRHDLAQWCRLTDAWLSKILGKDNRNVPLKHLDRIADFFGLATYQLFAPGVSSLTERRAGRDRRTGMDRRISQAAHTKLPQHRPEMETVTPYERAILARLRKLEPDDRKLIELQVDRLLLNPRRDEQTSAGATDQQAASRAPTETAPRIPKQRRRA